MKSTAIGFWSWCALILTAGLVVGFSTPPVHAFQAGPGGLPPPATVPVAPVISPVIAPPPGVSPPTTSPPVITNGGGKVFNTTYTQTFTFGPPPDPPQTVTMTMGGTGNTDPSALFDLKVSNSLSASVEIKIDYFVGFTNPGISQLNFITSELDALPPAITAGGSGFILSTLLSQGTLVGDDLGALQYLNIPALSLNQIGTASVATPTLFSLSTPPTGGLRSFAVIPPLLDPNLPVTALDLRLDFFLAPTPNGPVELSGGFNVPVPEPSSYVYVTSLALTLVGAGVWRRRQHAVN